MPRSPPSSTMSTTNPSSDSFQAIHDMLLSYPPPVLPPPKPHSASLTARISALSLHPTLEAAFHILNGDLPSAHFLVRQMQAPPAYEGMFLHGILHRVEGDYDNVRAWYGDVAGSDVFKHVWKGGLEEARAYVDEVESLRKRKEGKQEDLEKQSRDEIEGVIGWCVKKFGDGKWRDARTEYKQPEDEGHKKLRNDMVIGGEGFRKF